MASIDVEHKITKLLSSFNKKINELTQEDIDDIDDIKNSINSGFIIKVVQSIQEYISNNPAIESELEPETLGYYLSEWSKKFMGCDNNFCEDLNIFNISDNGVLEHVLVKPSFDAVIYTQNNFTIEHQNELATKGIARYKIYTHDGKLIYTYPEVETVSNMSSGFIVAIIMLCAIIMLGLLIPSFI